MAKMLQTPASVLQSLMDEYQLNPFSLSKAVNQSPAGVRQLVIGQSKVTVPTALRLAKLFGQTPAFWLDLQREVDLSEASKDKELQEILKGISKIKKPVVQNHEASKKSSKKKTVAEKSKTVAKGTGVKNARGKRQKSNATEEKD
jgi:addiction module HigA family antidote